MGSAGTFHLAKRGRKVVGFDRFSPPHSLGSSHGQTRIIREAYFEHPAYVPLVQRAYELWAELERESDRQLLLPTGGLMIGRPNSSMVTGALRSAEEHRLPFQLLSSDQVRQRHPALRPAEDMVGVWEPRAGILFPEKCVETHLALAGRFGAELHFDEGVESWHAEAGSIRVDTSRGRYHARRLILAAGPWAKSLLPNPGLPLSVERQVQCWFEPKQNAGSFQPEACPVHLWEHEPGRFFYGFPDLGEGAKVALHHGGRATEPDTLDREVGAADVEAMRQVVRRCLPDADGRLRSALVCPYTNTPDGHFLIDSPPGLPQVLVASPCSGHGFKFSSAIGEALADWVEGKTQRSDLRLFVWR